jgi:trehalose 6-phosphate phosphatase
MAVSRRLALLAPLLLPAVSRAQPAEPVAIRGAWARAAGQGQGSSGAYMTLTAREPLTLLDTHPMDRVEHEARALAAHHPNLLVETKRGSVALHYRLAPQLEEACLQAMQAAVAASPGLTLLRGKMVVEAKPGGASKGHAIEDFLREAPFAGRTPVFIGDDVTDEVGFSTVQRLGGVGIKVGEGATVAWRRLADPSALRRELQEAVAARMTRTA